MKDLSRMCLPEARVQRGLISIVEVLSLSVWFSVTAVFPSLRSAWSISAVDAAWLVSIVQMGFVAGALLSATFRLPDRVLPHKLLACCGGIAGACTALLPIFDSFWPAMVLRFITGVSLAGVYPVGMQLMASWSPPEMRGKTLGLLLAAIVVGSSLPHLIQAHNDLPWKIVIWISAALAGISALICAVWIRPGRYQLKLKVNSGGFKITQVFRSRAVRLVNLGYLGHMWELYAWWAWLPSFYLAVRGESVVSQSISLTIFAVLGVAGAAGCLIGGWAADRIGRARAAGMSLAISGTCCVLSPFAFSAPLYLVLLFMSIWGAAIVADSGIFSAALSESVHPELIGTALAIQTAIGFLLTNVSLIGVPMVADLLGWRFAFLLLVPGPIAGTWAMMRLNAQPAVTH